MTAWLDTALYPFAPHSFVTSDGAMSYLDEGSGPNVVLVHGTPSWSFEWRAVVQHLASDHRCIAPDHLGFGLSAKPRHAPLDPEAHAARLTALVESLDLRELTLVVHDFGGPIGLGAALRLGDRVKRIIVLNSWMWPTADDPAVRKLARLIESPLGAFLYRWLNFSARFLLPAMFSDRKKLTRPIHRHYLAPFARRAEREGPYAMARALLGANTFYEQLWAARGTLGPKITDVVWGDHDPAFTEKHLQRWLAAFPTAHVQQLPGVGHFVAEEAPDAIAAAVRASRMGS